MKEKKDNIVISLRAWDVALLAALIVLGIAFATLIFKGMQFYGYVGILFTALSIYGTLEYIVMRDN